MDAFRSDGNRIYVDAEYLELLIQTQGFVVVFEYNNNIYISYGGLGGVPDFNYYPTIAIVNNPALNISKTFKINWGY